MHHFTDQVIWITGASSGIGAALALEFAKQGAILCISARRKDRLQSLSAKIREQGGRASAFPCDVTKEEDIARVVQAIVAQYGQLDCAIANAGFAVTGRIESLKVEEWKKQLDVNVIGAAITAKHALAELRRSKGRMVLIGSVMSMVSTSGTGAYSASKYALRSIGQTLSLELHGSGVSCTTIHPGFVQSEISQVDNQGTFHLEQADTRPAKLMWTSEKAARVMVKAMAKRKREFVFTGHGKVGGYLGRHFPGLVHLVQTRR